MTEKAFCICANETINKHVVDESEKEKTAHLSRIHNIDKWCEMQIGFECER